MVKHVPTQIDYNLVKEFCDICLFNSGSFRYVIYNDIQRCTCWKTFIKCSVSRYIHSTDEDFERLFHKMYVTLDASSWIKSSTFTFKTQGHTLLMFNRCIVPNIYISFGCIYGCPKCMETRQTTSLSFLYKKQTFQDILDDIAKHTEYEESMRFVNWFLKNKRSKEEA